jgi:acyl-coenzyme A synthetase/AMP-(fatty) acid ligase
VRANRRSPPRVEETACRFATQLLATLDLLAERVRFGAWSADGANDPQDELFVALPRGDAAQLPERNEASDTACIFCTSGTTARPKIVIYNHAAYWMNGLDTLEFLGLTEDDRTLEYRSFGWNSAQVLSLMPFLQKGLTMHIARRFSHSHFFEWVQRHGITFSAGVPTVLNILLNKPIGFTAKDIAATVQAALGHTEVGAIRA